jgi:Raf kinase inhibitor-like YbhB/YbcL family protein
MHRTRSSLDNVRLRGKTQNRGSLRPLGVVRSGEARSKLARLVLVGLAFGFAVPISVWAQEVHGFELRSSAFSSGGTVPMVYSCFGENQSPPLAWNNPPKGTKTFALIVEDSDSHHPPFIHWVIYNIPAQVRSLQEHTVSANLPAGTREGLDTTGKPGYMGPCPPLGRPHHYHFRLYSLDSELDLPDYPRADYVKASAKNHLLATTELVGIFASKEPPRR